jgi:hypothetical protein
VTETVREEAILSPVPARLEQLRVTDPAERDFHQDLAGFERGNLQFDERERLAGFDEDGG